MLRAILTFCLSRRPLVIISFFAFLGIGFAAFRTLNIEAYPDPAPPIIEIIAQWPGQSPEEVERYVTVPIEIALSSTPGLKFTRSNTVFALGFIRLQFEYGQDYHFVRQQAINRLKDVNLPAGVQPVISPAGGISEIFRYELKGPPGMDIMELKTLQDWVVERKLRIVPGVADVAVLGGNTKEYQAEVDLGKMMSYGLTLSQIINALSASNSNVGGRTISMGEQSVNVRGLGSIASLEDISNTVIVQQGGVPILLSDVAKVQIGARPRLGMSGRDDKTDVITGIVLMQKLEKTMEVVERVRAAVKKINSDGSLPAGVTVSPFYDRGDLVAITIDTVLHSLVFGILLIFVIQWLFLGNLRCAIIVAATIPVALLLAVIITILRGESANLLSVGAIDLGIIVDGTVIMVENIYRRLAHYDAHDHQEHESISVTAKLHRILTAAVEVDKAILFSVIITIAAFLPLFTMQGVEGQIFGPMARTYAYALLGAVIATFTVTPVIASYLLPARVAEVETFLVRGLRRVYEAILPAAVRNYRISIVFFLAFLALCGGAASRLGTEFLPKLEEGNMWIRAVLPPTISLEAGSETVARIRRIIMSYPPVSTVLSEQGRGDEGTDPDGSFLAEFFVPLKPQKEWPKGLTKEILVKTLSDQLNREFVGVDFNFSQYIQDNMEEAVSGVKGENSIKVFGRDLAELERLAKAIKSELLQVPGVRDPAAFNLLGQPNLVIRINRVAAARYGFSISDINAVIQAAIGGQEVSRIYEGEMNFALTVRLSPEYRRNVDSIRAIPVALPSNDSKAPAYIALGELADVRLESGAAYVYRENSQRFIPIKYSVRDRDLGSTVEEAQRRIAEKVPLPQGYSMEWSGEFGALQEAKKRLAFIVPLSLMLILMLLYSLFNSIRDSLLALSGIPFAVGGGILGLYFGGQNFSVSAAVGFISLFGVAAMDGILLVSYIRKNLEEGMATEESIIIAGKTRMRQIFMTGLSACIGLVPAAISTGIGSQVQQPLACVIVGGMLISPIFSLLVIPTLSRIFMPYIAHTHDETAAPVEHATAH
jgi:cobalt-zinc-cadmium resistance protein CzcA